jgi:hypothetical protein
MKKGKPMAKHTQDREPKPEAKSEPRTTLEPKATPQEAPPPTVTPIDVGPAGIRPEEQPPATVTALEPPIAIAGDPTDIKLIVHGTGFNKSSVIVFNGYDEPTTFIDSTRLSTGVKPSLFVVPASCPVGVRNAGYALGNTMNFDFVETAVPPAEPPPEAEPSRR